MASAKLTDVSLYDVQMISEYVPENNVTGPSLSGKAFNA